MSFLKFSEWVSLREDAGIMPNSVAPVKKGPTAAALGKPANPRVAKAVADLAKKSRGKVDPAAVVDAVAKAGGSNREIMQAAKDASEVT